MKIASAQMNPKQGDIIYNLQEHYQLVELAIKNGVDLIVFPEMSITGYFTKPSKKLLFTENDSRIEELMDLSVNGKIIIIVGVPIIINSNIHIGEFIIFPNGSLSIYSKQFLHIGEEKYFKPSMTYNLIINIANQKISLAICADINNLDHAENAYKLDSTIYIASIFYTFTAIEEAYNLLNNYSRKFSMNVVMANYCGNYCDKKSGGNSALWSKDGRLISALDSLSTGLVIGDFYRNNISGIVIKEE